MGRRRTDPSSRLQLPPQAFLADMVGFQVPWLGKVARGASVAQELRPRPVQGVGARRARAHGVFPEHPLLLVRRRVRPPFTQLPPLLQATAPGLSCKGSALQTVPACVISTGQAPSHMVTTLAAKVKRFPRNPRVRVATAGCWDAPKH
jgi:hypothetical protein